MVEGEKVDSSIRTGTVGFGQAAVDPERECGQGGREREGVGGPVVLSEKKLVLMMLRLGVDGG